VTRTQAAARLRKLEAMTVERGATPAEAAAAARQARRLIRRFGLPTRTPGPEPRGGACAPGVHVVIVRRRAFASLA
jgi:hypothetical protein